MRYGHGRTVWYANRHGISINEGGRYAVFTWLRGSLIYVAVRIPFGDWIRVHKRKREPWALCVGDERLMNRGNQQG